MLNVRLLHGPHGHHGGHGHHGHRHHGHYHGGWVQPWWGYAPYCDVAAPDPCFLPNYGCLQEWAAARYPRGQCHVVACANQTKLKVCI